MLQRSISFTKLPLFLPLCVIARRTNFWTPSKCSLIYDIALGVRFIDLLSLCCNFLLEATRDWIAIGATQQTGNTYTLRQPRHRVSSKANSLLENNTTTDVYGFHSMLMRWSQRIRRPLLLTCHCALFWLSIKGSRLNVLKKGKSKKAVGFLVRYFSLKLLHLIVCDLLVYLPLCPSVMTNFKLKIHSFTYERSVCEMFKK